MGGFIDKIGKKYIFNNTLNTIENIFKKIRTEEISKKAELVFILTLVNWKGISRRNFPDLLTNCKTKVGEILSERGLEDIRLNFTEYKYLTSKLLWYKFIFRRYNLANMEEKILNPRNTSLLNIVYENCESFMCGKLQNAVNRELLEKYISEVIYTDIDLVSSISFLREGCRKKLDIVNRNKKNIVKVEFSDQYNPEWDKSLLNKKLLKKYGLDTFEKIGVYLGETFETNSGVIWMSVYDFMKYINREHLLEPVEEEKLTINTVQGDLSWN